MQIWNMQNDAATNAAIRVIGETGTRRRSRPGHSAISMRSTCPMPASARCRARNYTNTAGVNDVGTPIDPVVLEWIDTLASTVVESACSCVTRGTALLARHRWPGVRVLLLSVKEDQRVVMVRARLHGRRLPHVPGQVYARSGDVIYLYGGDDNATYGDDYAVTAAYPFVTAGKDATFKQWVGMDMAGSGTWDVTLLVNPNDENEYVDLGALSGVTFPEEIAALVGHATHVAPVLVHQGAGYASLSKLALEYEGAEAKA